MEHVLACSKQSVWRVIGRTSITEPTCPSAQWLPKNGGMLYWDVSPGHLDLKRLPAPCTFPWILPSLRRHPSFLGCCFAEVMSVEVPPSSLPWVWSVPAFAHSRLWGGTPLPLDHTSSPLCFHSGPRWPQPWCWLEPQGWPRVTRGTWPREGPAAPGLLCSPQLCCGVGADHQAACAVSLFSTRPACPGDVGLLTGECGGDHSDRWWVEMVVCRKRTLHSTVSSGHVSPHESKQHVTVSGWELHLQWQTWPCPLLVTGPRELLCLC